MYNFPAHGPAMIARTEVTLAIIELGELPDQSVHAHPNFEPTAICLSLQSFFSHFPAAAAITLCIAALWIAYSSYRALGTPAHAAPLHVGAGVSA